MHFQNKLDLQICLFISTLQYSFQILLGDDSGFSVNYVNTNSENISEKYVPMLVNNAVTIQALSQISTICIEPLDLFLNTNDTLSCNYDNILRHSI